MYSCKIIADSLSPQNNRLITFVVNYPRIVHSEMMTHRMFSRNSASSRAIPFKKMIKMVKENPFIPVAFQHNHKGMQGSNYFTNEEQKILAKKHLKGRDRAIETALDMAAGIFDVDEIFEFNLNGALITKKNVKGVTKQIVNRYLEPFMWHKVIITSSEEGLMNFFNLRCPQYEYIDGRLFKSKKDILNDEDVLINDKKCLKKYSNTDWLSINESQADIHIQVIAELMWDCYNESKPKQLKAGEWHIPFGDNIDEDRAVNLKIDGVDVVSDSSYNINKHKATQEVKVKIATARCARISYNNFLGKDDYEADIDLYNSLVERPYTNRKGIVFKEDDPVHASPAEHCAKAMNDSEYQNYVRGKASHNDSTYDNPIFQQKEMGWCRNFKGFIQLREIQENK